MGKCKYNLAWVGECGMDVERGDFCSKHLNEKCGSCGAQATHQCDYTGQFVCGVPLCDSCTGTMGDSSKGLGWGFIGHRHIPKGGDA